MIIAHDTCIPDDLNGNFIIGKPILKKSAIYFTGKNNYVIFENGASLENSIIRFKLNNSLVYINSPSLKLGIELGFNSTIYIGKDVITASGVHLAATESSSIIIGNECIIGGNVKIWTTDFHPIYSISDNSRQNPGESILIGDHVWIGNTVSLLKGCKIGSGSIIGHKSLCSRLTAESNSLYAGVPAKKIKDGIFWVKESPMWMPQYNVFGSEKKSCDREDKNMYIFTTTHNNKLNLPTLRNKLDQNLNCEKKIIFLKELSNLNNQNRFSIEHANNDDKKFLTRMVNSVKLFFS